MKETINKVKKQHQEWEKIIYIYKKPTDKELISKIYKPFTQFNIRKTTQSKKRQKT